MTPRPEDLPAPQWLTEEEQADWRAFLHGARLLEVALDTDLSTHGVSFAEYEILSMVSEAPGRQMRMSALAELVVQSRSRVTHTAARLEARGLVRRRPCPDDGRGVELALTDTGRELLDWLAVVHLYSVREHFVDLLTPEQFRAVGEAMSIIRAHGRPRQ